MGISVMVVSYFVAKYSRYSGRMRLRLSWCVSCVRARCKAKLLSRWWYQWALVAPLANPVSVYTLNKCTQHRYDDDHGTTVPANVFGVRPIYGVSVCVSFVRVWIRCPTSDYRAPSSLKEFLIDFSANFSTRLTKNLIPSV